jgi:hypothetical protein
MNAAKLYPSTSTARRPRLQLVSKNAAVFASEPIVRELRSIRVREETTGRVVRISEYETNKGPFILWNRAA